MIDEGRFSIAGRMRAFGYAIAGLFYAFKIGHALWIQCAIAAIIIFLGFYFHITLSDWRWIAVATTIVLATEIMNTAVESVCDALHPDHNKLIGIAKDAAAGAVLMAAIGAIVIGTMTFWPYLF